MEICEHSTVRVDRSEGIAVISLDNPPVNAINLEVLSDLEDCYQRVEEDGETQAIIMTGAGRCLSAGLDLKAVPHYSPSRQREMVETINRVITRFYSIPIPTVAAVNGHAIAGGFIMVLTCDYRIGTTLNCSIGLTESRVGIPFPVATLEVVKTELSPGVLRHMILPGRTVSPQDALEYGILDELQPHDELLARAREIALEFSRLPREGYSRIKTQLRSETISRIRETLKLGDPLLRDWMTEEAKTASAERLADPDQ